MRYLTFSEILEIYNRVMQRSGGMVGIRDMGLLESAVAQPRMTFETAKTFIRQLLKRQGYLASPLFKTIRL